ncbi:MAG TPA: hypothetical protein VNC61_09690 [Acidimicrobiales bacterium]|nr:hypothetical protein [Acidimicrobiales bacterium]
METGLGGLVDLRHGQVSAAAIRVAAGRDPQPKVNQTPTVGTAHFHGVILTVGEFG